MKKLALAALFTIAAQLPAWANQPFRYSAKCYVGQIEDECVVIETRESGGGLKSRNIFSNRAGLTIKMRWNGEKFITWDSHNKFEYHWIYKVNPDVQENGISGTYVMPGVTVVNVSWD